jgi:hypothetical protein
MTSGSRFRGSAGQWVGGIVGIDEVVGCVTTAAATGKDGRTR